MDPCVEYRRQANETTDEKDGALMDLRKFFGCLSEDERIEMKNIVNDHFTVSGQQQILTDDELKMDKLRAIQSVRFRLNIGLVTAKNLVEREQLERR